jgi:hypothetical protein
VVSEIKVVIVRVCVMRMGKEIWQPDCQSRLIMLDVTPCSLVDIALHHRRGSQI